MKHPVLTQRSQASADVFGRTYEYECLRCEHQWEQTLSDQDLRQRYYLCCPSCGFLARPVVILERPRWAAPTLPTSFVGRTRTPLQVI